MGKDLKGKEIGSGLSQRKDGSYCGRYINRFGQRKSLYDKDLRALKKKLSEAIYEDNNELNIADKSITLDQWFDKWMIAYKNETIKPNTKRGYNHVYKKLISPHLGMLPICEITKLQVATLLNKLKQNGYQWESQSKVRMLLVDMFNRALEDNFVKKNPAKGVKLPSNKPENERRVLTKEEQTLFFECAAGTFYNNLFVVAVNTGLRPGELFALSWSDIDFENKTISVSKTLVYQQYEDDECKQFHLEEPKTPTSNRVVPINSICEVALKRQYVQKSVVARRNIKPTKFGDLLFTTKYNTPISSAGCSSAIQSILSEINLMQNDFEQIEHFGAHTFRHTFATRCIESGVQPKTLQKLLGHATLQMTMDLYVHVTDDTLQEQMKLLENELNKLSINDEYIETQFNKTVKNDKKVINISGVRVV